MRQLLLAPNAELLAALISCLLSLKLLQLQGLEDQLLGEVVRKERPDLEEQKDRLVLSIAADKKQLAELEDKVGSQGRTKMQRGSSG